MQDKKYLATIVPLGPQARKQIQKGENLDVIRAAVWSETAKTHAAARVCVQPVSAGHIRLVNLQLPSLWRHAWRSHS